MISPLPFVQNDKITASPPLLSSSNTSSSSSLPVSLYQEQRSTPKGIQGTLKLLMTRLKNNLDSQEELRKNMVRAINYFLEQDPSAENLRETFTFLIEVIETRSLYAIHHTLNALSPDLAENAFYKSLYSVFESDQCAAWMAADIKDLPQKIQKQFEWKAINRDEMLNILIYLTKNERRTSFDCTLVEYRELERWLKQKKEQMKEGRFQTLVRNDVHYTAIEFQIQAGTLRCCILDASQDPKHKLLVKMLQSMRIDVTVIGENLNDKIQYDSRSCSIFSLDQLKHSSESKDFFDHIDSVALSNGDHPCKRVSWNRLPPDLIKGAQELAFFETYLAHNSPNTTLQTKQPLEDYLHENVDKNCTNSTEQNKTIEKILQQYCQQVANFLSENSPEEIARLAFPL